VAERHPTVEPGAALAYVLEVVEGRLDIRWEKGRASEPSTNVSYLCRRETPQLDKGNSAGLAIDTLRVDQTAVLVALDGVDLEVEAQGRTGHGGEMGSEQK
jgi:hypothetical protein